ncbi:hypothetical protein GCM10009678_25120 [Actinomadura kijaniata]
MELINPGFSGGALLDPFSARAMRDTPAVHGFLDTIREGRPTTPLLVVSPPRVRPRRTPPALSCPTSAAVDPLAEGSLTGGRRCGSK